MKLHHLTMTNFMPYSPNGSRIISASYDKTARMWDARILTMSIANLVEEVCRRRLKGSTTFTPEEMRFAGYEDSTQSIDVCSTTK
jgi:WD40 repeat protein